MKPSESSITPSIEDFAIEEFDEEALIVRLADMRIFRVNRHALELFNIMLQCRCDIDAAANRAGEEGMDLDPGDLESLRTILDPAGTDRNFLT
jgi:hypothetical protein